MRLWRNWKPYALLVGRHNSSAPVEKVWQFLEKLKTELPSSQWEAKLFLPTHIIHLYSKYVGFTIPSKSPVLCRDRISYSLTEFWHYLKLVKTFQSKGSLVPVCPHHLRC